MARRTLVSAALAALFSAPAASAQPVPLPPRDAQAPFVARASVAATVAHARPVDDARVIAAGLRRAVADGRLSRAEAREYRATVGRARAVLSGLPRSRRVVLARVLGQVRRHAGAFNGPRALALFSMLDENARYLARRALPPAETDVVGRDGIIYRVGWGYGLQFHPLANAIAINLHLYGNRYQRAAALASALAARAVPTRRGAVWEYYFPYAGGAPPWTSGMAQAIGAQAFARMGVRIPAPDLLAVARRAYRAIPGRLVREFAGGPWVRLYSFSRLVVLNAQLQSVLSLRDFGRIANEPGAIALAERLEATARAELSRFDTGYWTNYSPGREAPLRYHLYHGDLTKWLAQRFRSDAWASAHARFTRYTREPPVFKSRETGPPIYPWPADGFRDGVRIAFWVSKISTVRVRVGGAVRSVGLSSQGWHAFIWRPGRKRPGVYRPVVVAVDLAGNRGSASLDPVTIEVDREPPALTAKLSGRILTWRARDPTSPWLRLTVVFERAGARRVSALGRRPLSGSARLRIPRGSWSAALVAADTSGNRVRVPLGAVPPARR